MCQASVAAQRAGLELSAMCLSAPLVAGVPVFLTSFALFSPPPSPFQPIVRECCVCCKLKCPALLSHSFSPAPTTAIAQSLDRANATQAGKGTFVLSLYACLGAA